MCGNGTNIGSVPDCLECEEHEMVNKMLEDKLTRIVGWLEENQPDVFKRSLWDAISGKPGAPVHGASFPRPDKQPF